MVNFFDAFHVGEVKLRPKTAALVRSKVYSCTVWLNREIAIFLKMLSSYFLEKVDGL